ncbi:hypothetical protein CCMSSC00406_0004319 [Pleurotus cornucopiae]|uniref:Uncharacterized protein n=1 Tax=Pleurotus cornucopiae TaxID=5321 RepID=A0ACB7J989_PLECO|nr:hypothetical protein CCMSSC00406_0004319 [Pleurotus cornucopiae]
MVEKAHQDARRAIPRYIFGFLEEISKTINIAKLFAGRHVLSRWLLRWQNKSTIANYTAQLQNALDSHGGPKSNMANVINNIVDDDGAIRAALRKYLSPAGIAPSSPAAAPAPSTPSANLIGNGSMTTRRLDGNCIVNNCTINRRTENSGNITNIRTHDLGAAATPAPSSAATPMSRKLGLQCSPVANLIGGGPKCSGQTVCCENIKFKGLVNIGCTPINIGL